MIRLCHKIIIPILLLAFTASAQSAWPSPEVEQMYHHAQQYAASGNYKDAITTYRQAIVLAPGQYVLYKELGKTLYSAGNYTGAAQVLSSAIKPGADAECYELLAATYAAQKDTKAAKAIINKGLAQFPLSGQLYYQLGIMYDMEKDTPAALDAWVSGICKAPAFPSNYYKAAGIYLAREDVLWGLIYGEIFLNISADTIGADAFKRSLFTGYKTMFDNIVNVSGAEQGKKSSRQPTSFATAVQDVYLGLTPVISDGITTENLTMVRTRFLMQWQTQYAGKYPCSLFTYQDHLLRSNLFDIYNEWLFGKAESMTEYNAWLQFHPVEMDILSEKKQAHPLTPLASDCYDEAAISKRKR